METKERKQHGPDALERAEAANHNTFKTQNITVASQSEVISLTRFPALLRHHASYIEIVLFAICAGQSISIAGRQALQYTADRLRRFAEVME